MTIVAARHLKSDDLEFIVLCTDSRSVVTGQPPGHAQKIYRAGDFFVAGTGNLHLLQVAADYADRVCITPPGMDKVLSNVVTGLNRYLHEEIPDAPEQLEEYKTNIQIAGPERTDGGVSTGLALFNIDWEHMLRSKVPDIPTDYVIAGSGKSAVEKAQQAGKNWAPPITEVQDLGGALLDAYYTAIVAGRDPAVDREQQFAIQIFRHGTFSEHLLLPQVLIGEYPLLVHEDFVKLFLGRKYSDRAMKTQDNFRTESTWLHAFYEVLVNQLASIMLRQPKSRSPAQTSTFVNLDDPMLYEEVRKELPGTLNALTSGNLATIRESVKASAAYVDFRLREQLGIQH